ncbi:MAG: nuclear transport factor 2 family protein [Ornithinimicrobium sp.]
MSDTDRTQRFADALQACEQGDEQALLAQFAESAELRRPERKHGPGQVADPATFWQQYLAEFEHIETSFDRVTEEGDEGILEWHSTGTLATGRAIDYAGVSLLTFDGDAVSRFATYYDTAAFIEPTG